MTSKQLVNTHGNDICVEIDEFEGSYLFELKDLIFLPFNHLWEFLITFNVVLTILIVIYSVAYHANSTILNFLFYVLEVLYFLDFALTIAHRTMPLHAATREYLPKPRSFMLLDVISLCPIYEVYRLATAASRNRNFSLEIRNNLRMRCLLRIYRFFTYFIRMSYNAGINQILIVFVFHFVSFIIASHAIGAILFWLGCYKCDHINWTSTMMKVIFDDKSPTDWLIICFTTIGNIFTNNSRGSVRGETILERILIIITMLVGFLVHYMIFCGKLIGVYEKLFRRRFIFEDNLKSIRHFLRDLEVDKSLEKQTKDYYNILWRRRQGIRSMPKIFSILPAPLQKEVTLDIFWDAIKHTHLYGKMEISFKRSLSLQMKNEFYMPGDFVYEQGKIKSKMIYIVSGILQVLAEEDEESPIMSFSSGTVLGEISSLMPYESAVHVQCATNCELQTLSIDALYKVLKDFPENGKALHRKLQHRIQNAVDLQDFADSLPEQIFITTVESGSSDSGTVELFSAVDPAIKWMKRQWKTLEHHHHMRDKRTESQLNNAHTSQYLDLLVFGKEVELKMQAICLRGSCPFLIDRNTSFRRFCSFMVFFATLLQCLLLPYNIVFNRSISNRLFGLFFCLDLIYVFDIYLSLSTVIGIRNQELNSFVDILKYRLKEISFCINVISAIPLDYVAVLMGTASSHVCALLKLNRLLKIYVLLNFFKEEESNIWINVYGIRLTKHILIYVITTYWFTCWVYSISCFYEECKYFGWFNYNQVIDGYRTFDFNVFGVFVPILYYVCSTYLRLSTSNQHMFLLSDVLVHHIIIITGYYVISYCYSQLCATFILEIKSRRDYHNYLLSMSDFLKMHSVPHKLQLRILNVLRFCWYYNKNLKIHGKGGILEEAKPELRYNLTEARIKQCLLRVQLFSECDDKIISRITNICVLKTLPSNFVVIETNKRSTWMHIILRGYCRLESTMAGDRERKSQSILFPGDAFPVVEVLHQVESLVTVKTETAVEIISIKYSDIDKLLLGDSIFGKPVIAAREWHLSTFETALLRKHSRLPEMIPAERSLGKGDYFTYSIHDNECITSERKAYLAPFEAMGKLHMIRYLLLPYTIDPHKKFFMVWEILRCVFACLRITLCLTYTSLLAPYKFVLDYILLFLNITSYMDFYVRLHCQYYNNKGILVTHPLCTAKNYLRTSFIIDLISSFPFRAFKIHEILSYSHKETAYGCLLAASSPWQLYRVMGALNYLQSNIERRIVVLQGIKYSILVVVVIATMAVVLQVVTCTITTLPNGMVDVACKDKSWIRTTFLRETVLNHFTVYVHCLYVSVIMFTAATCGSFSASTEFEFHLNLVMVVSFFFFRWLIMAKLVSYRVGGNVSLIIYQEQVRSFLNFIKSEQIDEELVRDVVTHYEYIWKKTQGSNISTTLNKLHANLHEDIVYYLYGPTFETVELLQGADESLLKELGTIVDIKYFRKDSDIVRCNDVQGLLYIVYKGKVDIFVAQTKVCTLGPGGLFGCLQQKGVTRQTISVRARVHVEVLAVNSNQFHATVKHFPVIVQRLEQAKYFNIEYAEPRGKVAFSDEMASTATSKESISIAKVYRTNWSRVRQRMKFLINHEEKWYFIWEYILCVHFSCIISMIHMFYIIMINEETTHKVLKLICVYGTDLLFIIKIGMGFFVTYVDSESGITITNLKSIQVRFAKSFLFWQGVLTSFPFEIIAWLITNDPLIINYSSANRIFRFLYLTQYYKNSKLKVHVRTHLRWTYLIYWSIISIQLMTCVWYSVEPDGVLMDIQSTTSTPSLRWITACSSGFCYSTTKALRPYDMQLVTSEHGFSSFIIAYGYIVNLFTATGLRRCVPFTISQLLVTILITCAFQFNTVALTSEFATLLQTGQYSLNKYEYGIHQLRTYLMGRELSQAILHKVWKYDLQLWQRQRGEWMPIIVTKAPNCLKQDIMLALYGNHFLEHFIFATTHTDFLRQLVMHLQRCVFFPGNCIAESGDIDGSMYFIHDGEVNVYMSLGNKQTLHTILTVGQTFGEAQCLFNIPHQMTYKAKTVVDALILKGSDWKYLLQWFPAADREIKYKAEENGICPLNTNDIK